MGLIKKLAKTTVFGAAATTGAFYFLVRDSKLGPVSTSDDIFKHAAYKKLNPNDNPHNRDVVTKKVPLSKIKPELLKDQAKLTERFCAGIWSGYGYHPQRLYLQSKYRGQETADQLWDLPELESSTYELGTKITDHFEVVSKTPEAIIVRCGGSPRIQDIRDGDGLFEMSTQIKENEGIAEFGLKSVLFAGTGKPEVPPMSPWMQWLHVQYAKLWMEAAVRNVAV